MGALVPLILTPLPIDAKPSGEGARDARDRLSIPLQEATGQQDPPLSPRSFFITLTTAPASAEGEFQLWAGWGPSKERERVCPSKILESQKS